MSGHGIRVLRWWMIGLLMLGSIINYLTRATLGVAAPTVLQDLYISAQQYSWIVGAFQFAIMLQPICGYVLDVLGLRVGLAIFAIAIPRAVVRRPAHAVNDLSAHRHSR